MLFGYPVAATANNWLHECIFEAMEEIHRLVSTKQALPIWPAILRADCRDRLRARTSLKNALEGYAAKLARLSAVRQETVRKALVDQNRIPELLSGVVDCQTLDSLPVSIQKPIRTLFEGAFRLLTDLQLRDEHYRSIYTAVSANEKMCPFCGFEYFDPPGARQREDLDHFLAESLYPFAAVNLRNLVPMGHKCNSLKRAQNIVKHAGVARRCFDPYNNAAGVSLTLDRSEPFAGKEGECPRWEIDFTPDGEETRTWDSVFQVRERYKTDVLDEWFKTWLRDFSAWRRSTHVVVDSTDALVEALGRYITFLATFGFRESAFLKVAMFRMLRSHCIAGNQRLITLLRDLTHD